MKRNLVLVAVSLLLFPAAAGAFTLQNNAQCVGGALVNSYNDVSDGGGLAVYTNGKMLAQGDCEMLTEPGQCCSVHVSTNGAGIGGNIIPYTWFSYEIFQGALVQGGFGSYQNGVLANTPGSLNARTIGRQGKYFAGIKGGITTTTATTTETTSVVTASLVANPTSIDSGEQSLLTWASSGALSCTGNFPTGGATFGSVLVRPNTTTEYFVTCTNQSATTASCLADGEEVPAGHICSEDRTISPPRANIEWGACCSNMAVIICPAPNEPAEGFCTSRPRQSGSTGSETSSSSGQSATAYATVTVTDGSLQVSCRAYPARAAINEDVLWSSSVSGPVGTYTYLWSGTDGLTGTVNQLFKKYTTIGHKDAWLTVTYTPPGDIVTPPTPDPSVCPLTGWITPVSPCAGSWSPTYGADGCQSGWRCALSTSGVTGGGDRPLYLQYWNTLTSFLLFDRTDPQFMDPNYVETVQMIESTVKGAMAESKTVQCESGVDVVDGTPQCRDSVDNDGDGKIDYPEDIGCLSPDDDSEVNGGGVGQCEDGLDNDQDGTSDENDSGCFSNGTYNPNENETSPQCSDGIDNDGNGTVDFPDDIGCSSADDNDEYSKASLSLKSSPALIKKGEVCTLKASAENVTSCTVTGDGVSQALKVGKNGVVNETTILSPKLAGTTTYTLSCKSSSGTVSEKTQCKVTPSFEEF